LIPEYRHRALLYINPKRIKERTEKNQKDQKRKNQEAARRRATTREHRGTSGTKNGIRDREIRNEDYNGVRSPPSWGAYAIRWAMTQRDTRRDFSCLHVGPDVGDAPGGPTRIHSAKRLLIYLSEEYLKTEEKT
jgi:hypothetical protein